MKQFAEVLSKRKIAFLIVSFLLILGAGIYAWQVNINNKEKLQSIDSFEECVATGVPIREIYPEQCVIDGKTFTNPAQSIQ